MDHLSEKKEPKHPVQDIFSAILSTIRMFFDMGWIDLHGMSISQAKIQVEKMIKYSCEKGNNRCRIITGRGNHINAKGERGVIFSQCEDWLTSSELSPLIESYEKRDGHYMLKLKTDRNLASIFQNIGQNIIIAFYKENLRTIQEEAENGCSESQFRLGCGYLISVESLGSDYKKAFFWLSKAAKQEHPYAQEFVGMLYLIGEGVKQNDGAGMDWLKKAAKNGSGDAAYYLSSHYLFGWGCKFDPKQTVAWTVCGANLNHVPSIRRVGNLYFENDPLFSGIVEHNPVKALSWYLRAAKLGDSYSQYQLGTFYKSGIAVPINLVESFKYFFMAAQSGDSDAMLALAICYLCGQGCEKDIDTALEWLNKAVSFANAEAIDLLSTHYLETGNEQKAISLLKESAHRGVINSQIKLLFLPNIAAENREQALSLLLKQPNSEIQRETGKNFQILFAELLLYKKDTKKITRSNKKRAIMLLEQLLDENFSIAALLLGACFLPNQPAKVIDAWKKGIELGDSDCMFLLGLFYAGYKKEEQHNELSKKYLTMSAQKSHKASMQQLASEVLMNPNPSSDILEQSIVQLTKLIDLNHKQDIVDSSLLLSDIGNIKFKATLTLITIFLRYRNKLEPNNSTVKMGITYLQNNFDLFPNGGLQYNLSLYLGCYPETFEQGMHYLDLAAKIGNKTAFIAMQLILENPSFFGQITEELVMAALPPLEQLRFDVSEINAFVKQRKRDPLESIIMFELLSKQSKSPIFEEQNNPDSTIGTLREKISILALRHNSIFIQSLNPKEKEQKSGASQTPSFSI